ETMAGLRQPAAGSIIVDGLPLWKGGRPQRDALLRFGIAMQRSEAQWFARTAREELLYAMQPYGLPAEEREGRLAAAWAASGLPAGETERRPAWSLSGGEQRRLAWACLAA